MNTSTQIGKYTLEKTLGEGGFGMVYLARETAGQQQVAVKVMHPHLTRAPDMIERFRREYNLAARLEHPNILRMLEAGEYNGSYYLVMEYIDGEPLSSKLVAGRPMTLEQAVEILEPLASALDYAHAQGMIHRDVKPSNVIIDRRGRPVLTDFGLVKLVSADGQELTTSTGQTLGTVAYMSPERIQGLALEPASDQYSLGVVAYQMLAGQPPFKNTSDFVVQQEHVSKLPPNPRIANPELQPEVVPALERALAKDPHKRYPCAMEFVADLKRVVANERQARARVLLEQARQAEERGEIDAALTAIDEARRLAAGPETEQAFDRVLHKKTALQKYEQLRNNERAIRAGLERLQAENPWLPQPEPSRPPALTAPLTGPRAWLIPLVKIVLGIFGGHYGLITFMNLFTGYEFMSTTGYEFVRTKIYGVNMFSHFVIIALAITLLVSGLLDLSRRIVSLARSLKPKDKS